MAKKMMSVQDLKEIKERVDKEKQLRQGGNTARITVHMGTCGIASGAQKVLEAVQDGGKLEFKTVQGHDFPEDLPSYRLVVHCGACMMNRREMLTRILRCRQAGVPITNYGLTIAYSLGIFERALEPFPTALEIYRRTRAALTGTCPASPAL
jgi:hypothetical protein